MKNTELKEFSRNRQATMNDKNNGIWFRVWNEETKSWVYGVPMYTKDELRVYTDPYNNPEQFVSLPLAMETFHYLKELPNGQNLYEGDIIKKEYAKDKFVYGEVDICENFYLYDDSIYEDTYSYYDERHITVIGNVVENPHMSEQFLKDSKRKP